MGKAIFTASRPPNETYRKRLSAMQIPVDSSTPQIYGNRYLVLDADIDSKSSPQLKISEARSTGIEMGGVDPSDSVVLEIWFVSNAIMGLLCWTTRKLG